MPPSQQSLTPRTRLLCRRAAACGLQTKDAQHLPHAAHTPAGPHAALPCDVSIAQTARPALQVREMKDAAQAALQAARRELKAAQKREYEAQRRAASASERMEFAVAKRQVRTAALSLRDL